MPPYTAGVPMLRLLAFIHFFWRLGFSVQNIIKNLINLNTPSELLADKASRPH